MTPDTLDTVEQRLSVRAAEQIAGSPRTAAIQVGWSVQGAGLDGRRLYFWYDRGAFTTGDAQRDAWLIFHHSFADVKMQLDVLDSLTSLWLWDRTNLNFEMPHLSDAEARGIATSAPLVSLVLLCQRPADCTTGVNALAARGIVSVTRVLERIAEGDALDLTILIVDAVPAQ